MQISVENTSDIGRKLTIEVPEEKVQAEVDTRLKSLARRVKVDGFRPGKVPPRIVRQRFGKQVREEVVYDLIGASLREAIEAQELKIAGEPKITPTELAEGKGLKFEAELEVYPEIELAAIEELEIAKPVCEITEADVEAMIEKLREQKKTWETVDRPAQEGDKVTLTFEALRDGEPVGEGKVEHFEVELGAGKMIPGFEDKLIGARAGDHLEFELTFPEDYHDEDLAGKTVLFKVDVEKVEEGRLPEVDAEFVKEYGVESGDVEEFRREVRANLERQLHTALKERIKERVLDALFEKNPIPVPEGLVKQEMQRALQPLAEALKQNPQLLEQLPLDNLRESARKRVALGLLLAEVIRANDLKADPEKVREAVEELAQSYEDPQAVVEWFYDNSEQLAQIESQVLEERAIEWILEHAKVTEEPVKFQDLINQQQQAA
ncbi:trigger factor [Methylomarinovum tepidoasis]|uniref:Trigger factor n=1 Tax=Methylomarinovum tepidoasis TaxID=2840183 RepID=A0AAU9CF28_9GAMM|nr:trigger factor [Methylomarinovum sp. IN45]BCX87816.1 trigger factor [Methylomarinovum sp. IN45]